jgi:hypothetical protein
MSKLKTHQMNKRKFEEIFLVTNSGAFADKRFPYFIFTIIAQALSSDETNSGSLANVSFITLRYFVCNSSNVSTNNVDN